MSRDKHNMPTWDLAPFADAYTEIRILGQPPDSIADLAPDLAQLLLVPLRNESSRKALANKDEPVKLHNGYEFRFNEAFVASVARFSQELDLDELCSAELLQLASGDDFATGASLEDAGFLTFFRRYEYILNIVGFLVSLNRVELISQPSQLYTQILSSYRKLYSILQATNDRIHKEKVTGDVNNLAFVNTITNLKVLLFSTHELLSRVLYLLIDKTSLPSLETYKLLSSLVDESVPEGDNLFLHFLPTLFKLVTSVEDSGSITLILEADYKLVKDADLLKLKLKSQTLSLFLAHLVAQNDKQSLSYIELLVDYGALEVLLNFSAETALEETTVFLEERNLFNFRPLLQKTLPKLKPVKFGYAGTLELLQAAKQHPNLSNVPRLCDVSGLRPSQEFCNDLIAPHFHSLFLSFISNAAAVLTAVRNTEEDYLLLSINREKRSELDLDDLGHRADLERFYLFAVYTYTGRQDLCLALWESEASVGGFISWGLANNTSPLISATFCLLLGSFASAGNNASLKLWEMLQTSSTRMDFSRISVDSIVGSLEYYIEALLLNLEIELADRLRLQKGSQELLFRKPSGGLMFSLSEDSIIFISGVFMLVSMLLRNANDNDAGLGLRRAAFARLSPLIVSFMKFDNLITHARLQSHKDMPKLFNDDNRSVIISLILTLLAEFVGPEDMRHKVWKIVDKWLCHALFDDLEPLSGPTRTEVTKLKALSRVTSVKTGLHISLSTRPEMISFVHLMKRLLVASPEKYILLYPSDLGAGYRPKNAIGIWPYIEFLMDVFASTARIDDRSNATLLQRDILEIAKLALLQVEWPITQLAPKLFGDLPIEFAECQMQNGIQSTLTFSEYVKLHHSVAFINYFFDEKCYSELFLIMTGEELETVKVAMEVLGLILDYERTFVEKLLPVIVEEPKRSEHSLALVARTLYETIYIPSNVGTKGLPNFFEAVLFNLPAIANVALFVGKADTELAKSAVKVLARVAESPLFANKSLLASDVLLKRNRLLSIFDSVDESLKIQYSFMQQIDSPYDLQLKFDVIALLSNNLKGSEITITHFLLGYDVLADRLRLPDGVLLLRSLLNLMMATLNLVFRPSSDQLDVGQGPAKLVALIMGFVVKLCSFDISGEVTLAFLREYGLFFKLLSMQPKIDDKTLWEGKPFCGDLKASDGFFAAESANAFLSFVDFRNSALQYLLLEFHSAERGRKEEYVRVLIDGSEYLNGMPKVLNLLDVLQFSFYGLEGSENVSLLESVRKERKDVFQEPLPSRLSRYLASLKAPMSETPDLDYVQKRFLVEDLKSLHLKTLHSWAQMVQVLSTDGVQDKVLFILEVLQVVLPRINNDYYEREVLFAEELVSLCVVLFGLYDEAAQNPLQLLKLIPLFKTCVSGVLSSNATPQLSLDLYVLLNMFLQKSLTIEGLKESILGQLRAADQKFVDIICNDLIYLEGPPRITLVLLLEALVNVSNQTVQNISKNNVLALLVGLLKRTDDLVIACQSPGSGILATALVQELMAFKATLYLLSRIAQSRVGAQMLVQNEIFSTVSNLRFLAIDCELGTDLVIDDGVEDKPLVQLHILLDEPLQLADQTILYYEFIVPAFQLIATALLLMGPLYQPGAVQSAVLMDHFRLLVTGVLKRDALRERDAQGTESKGLDELVRLFVLVEALTVLGAETAGTAGADAHLQRL